MRERKRQNTAVWLFVSVLNHCWTERANYHPDTVTKSFSHNQSKNERTSGQRRALSQTLLLITDAVLSKSLARPHIHTHTFKVSGPTREADWSKRPVPTDRGTASGNDQAGSTCCCCCLLKRPEVPAAHRRVSRASAQHRAALRVWRMVESL